MLVLILRYTIKKLVCHFCTLYSCWVMLQKFLKDLKYFWWRRSYDFPHAKFSGFSTKFQTSRPGKKTSTNSLLFPGFSIPWKPWVFTISAERQTLAHVEKLWIWNWEQKDVLTSSLITVNFCVVKKICKVQWLFEIYLIILQKYGSIHQIAFM